jgi:hypothetical protein
MMPDPSHMHAYGPLTTVSYGDPAFSVEVGECCT